MVLKVVMRLSTPQATVLAVTSLYFPPSTAHWFQVCFSCSFWAVSIGFPPDVDPERQRDDVSRSLQIKSNQKLCVPIDGFNWARMGQGMAHIPESWSVENQYVFLSSLRELCCHSLSPSVTPQSAVATQSPLTHLSILAMMAYRSLAYSPLQKENMSSYSPQTVLKKAPLPLTDLYSFLCPSICWTFAFIHLYPSIRLPVLAPCHLTPVSTTCLYARWGYLNGFC